MTFTVNVSTEILLLTDDRILIRDVFDPHSDVLHAEVHFGLIHGEVG